MITTRSASCFQLTVPPLLGFRSSYSAGNRPAIECLTDPRLVEEALEKKETMLKKVRALYEVNPMLGHRGVRLGLTFPEIYSMQISAILEAAAECRQEGFDIHPESQAVLGGHDVGDDEVVRPSQGGDEAPQITERLGHAGLLPGGPRHTRTGRARRQGRHLPVRRSAR